MPGQSPTRMGNRFREQDARRIRQAQDVEKEDAERNAAAGEVTRRGSSAAGHRIGAGELGRIVAGRKLECRRAEGHRHHGNEEEVDRFHVTHVPSHISRQNRTPPLPRLKPSSWRRMSKM